MNINTINTIQNNNAVKNDSTLKNRRTAVPFKSAQADCFILTTPPLPSQIGGLFGKITNKIKEVCSGKVLNPDSQEKINAIKLTKLFVDHGTFSSYKEAKEHQDFIKNISKLDYDKVEAKYLTVAENLKRDGITPEGRTYNEFYSELGPYGVGTVLSFDEMTPQDIDELFKIRRSRGKCRYDEKLSIAQLAYTMKRYENFELLPASEQKELMESFVYNFTTTYSLDTKEAKNISDYSSLNKFSYITDLKSVDKKDYLIPKLDERRKNIPCKPILTNKSDIKKVVSEEGVENLAEALDEVDLTKYEKGFPLEYSRADFVSDFTKITDELSKQEKSKVFKHYGFNITTNGDIINYPDLSGDMKKIDRELQPVISKLDKHVEKFMFDNKVKLEPEDKALEDELNKIIKAFPEFISIIGKIEHRGDSIDYHTLDDLKRIMSDDRFDELADNEKQILTVATLFHDFGKTQGEVDEGHAKKSAMIAKEIIKKTELSNDDKERIYNLINHSHWLVDGSSDKDIAFYFRRPNDFLMAEIFEESDSNSAGFEYAPSEKKIATIKSNIDKINTTGIPLFADNLPIEDKYYDKTPSGIRYLDFRDPEASAEKYGYPAGTKIKDLKFLCHSSSDQYDDFKVLCDDSKDVCLSTSLLDVRKKLSTGYNSSGAYILDASNANIIIGGKNVSCTGGRRGYTFAKNLSYNEDSSFRNKYRTIIPNQIKTELQLDDDEYGELYSQICNNKNVEDIKDITLASGKTIPKEDVINCINSIKEELVRPRREGESGYTNEIVVYNPKIEGEVTRFTPEQIDKFSNKERVYVIVK